MNATVTTSLGLFSKFSCCVLTVFLIAGLLRAFSILKYFGNL